MTVSFIVRIDNLNDDISIYSLERSIEQAL